MMSFCVVPWRRAGSTPRCSASATLNECSLPTPGRSRGAREAAPAREAPAHGGEKTRGRPVGPSPDVTCGLGLRLQHTVERHEEALDRKIRDALPQDRCRLLQVETVLLRFGSEITLEPRQPSVCSAVGVIHEDHTTGVMQALGDLDLLEDEGPLVLA